MKSFLRKYGIFCALLTISLVAFGQAGYIKAKALLAQHLLDSAWEQTLEDGRPHKPWSWADTYPVAKLEAPTQDIEQVVLAGASGRNLAFGPGHVLSSSKLTESGHVILGGHRDTHFEFLQYLKVGDPIILTNKYGESVTYKVTEFEVHHIEKDTLYDRGQNQITLITCYPFNTLETGGPLRYLVHGERA
ncbi:class GN sortase [Kangiella sediminilitoris]|uniref:Sortase family protein n=1 Tax=Kangiella sediminilitoris TaxID=1144748 RepID=A0A1B3B802_9GAMM|nr:class GN sortase [Kangiella sediminilitoris]AOE48906.1 Sortase family protein [Kangiella sediminilitoris]